VPLEVPDQVRLVEPPSSAARSAHSTEPWTSMLSSSPRTRRMRARVRGPRPTCAGELAIEVTVAHPSAAAMSPIGRPGAACSIRTASAHRARACRHAVPASAGSPRRGRGPPRAPAGGQRGTQGGGPRPGRQQLHDPAAQGGRGEPRAGRQPTGVVTIPTQYVSPRGSLTMGRSCGPMRKPVAATRAVSVPVVVCRIGSPRTTAATVEPVGRSARGPRSSGRARTRRTPRSGRPAVDLA
jgi:hypothetical protein